MKTFKRLFVALIAVMAFAVPSQAQLRFGVKAGIDVNKLSLNQDILDSSNRVGFTGGVMTEFTVPVVGLGFDASVLYARRSFETLDAISNEPTTYGRDYINIPVNFKWKIGIPAVNNLVSPFLTTGPSFSFLCSKKNLDNAWKNKTFDMAWNFGLGVQLINKIQLAASYGFGLTTSASGEDALNGGLKDNLKGKNHAWTVTLAYLF